MHFNYVTTCLSFSYIKLQVLLRYQPCHQHTLPCNNQHACSEVQASRIFLRVLPIFPGRTILLQMPYFSTQETLACFRLRVPLHSTKLHRHSTATLLRSTLLISRHWHASDGSTPKQTTSCCRQNQQLTLPHASQPGCATLLAITPTV